MSKLFSDPEYHRMSNDEEAWLELAIEPFRFYLNELIRSLPSSVELDFDKILNYVKFNKSDTYLSIEASGVLRDVLKEHTDKSLNRKVLETIEKMYEIKVSSDTVIDFVDKTITNPVYLSKKQDEIPEDEVMDMCADMSVGHIDIHIVSPQYSKHSKIISRCNEIIDILGADKSARSTRSLNNKSGFIRSRVYKIIKDDEWRIRNYDILVDLCKNITSYINDGNMHALMNVTRLKCMTHKGAPIYSMEEIK